MKKNKFTPETDYEKYNLDLIQRLRKIKDEDLSGDFDNKLYKKILSASPYNKKSWWIKTQNYFSYVFSPRKSSAYFVYAGFLACMFFIVYLLLSAQNSQQINLLSEDKKEQLKEKVVMPGEISKMPEPAKDDVYLGEFHKKVLMNLSYGFLNNPSVDEVAQALESEQFKKIISSQEVNTLEDSIRIVINILEDGL